jgi:hypothetical protein
MPETLSREEFYNQTCDWIGAEAPEFDRGKRSSEKRILPKRLLSEPGFAFIYRNPLKAAKSIMEEDELM